jgi:hypothetical protein
VSVQGAGKFTVRLGDLTSPVSEGFDRAATAKLWFLGDAFERFLGGTLPPDAPTRELIKSGDGDVLAGFGQFLSESAAILRLQKPSR